MGDYIIGEAKASISNRLSNPTVGTKAERASDARLSDLADSPISVLTGPGSDRSTSPIVISRK